MKKGIIVAALLALVFASPALAATDTPLVKPNTFSGGTPALAAEVNENFDTVYDRVNEIQDKNLVPIIWQADLSTDPGGFINITTGTEVIWPPDDNVSVLINTAGDYLSLNADGSFTIAKAGYYEVAVDSTVNSGNWALNCFFYVDDAKTGLFLQSRSTDTDGQLMGSRMLRLEAGSKLELRLLAGWGMPMMLRYPADKSHMSIRYLGPLETP